MKSYHFLIVSLGLLASCSKEKTAENTEPAETGTAAVTSVTFTPEQLVNAGIETGKPVTGPISGLLQLQGKIDIPPGNIISLSFPVSGYLTSAGVLPGTRIRKGQVLATLEDMQLIQLQQDYLTAKEKLQLAESEFSRQRELNQSKASSDKMLQQAKTEMETQRILTYALAKKLELIGISPATLRADNISRSVSIKSPINGFVSAVNVNTGKYTSPSDVLFELINPGDVHLLLNVFERDLNTLSVGQKVTAYTNGDPEKKYTATILLINRNLNADRTAEIHCHFSSHHAELVPGMFMNAEVETQSRQAITVPEEAVVKWENKSYVFRKTGNNKFDMTEVSTPASGKGMMQIESTLISTATELVTRNAYAVLMKIKNTEEE